MHPPDGSRALKQSRAVERLKPERCLGERRRLAARRVGHSGSSSGWLRLPAGRNPKAAFPGYLGAGRFAGIGIPLPDVTGPFVGLVEIACGALILIGLLTRLAAVPLVITMIVAILSTKIPIWLGHDWLIFHVRDLSRYGFWSFIHETRTDRVMLTCAIYLLTVGGGRGSLDDVLYRRALTHLSDGEPDQT